MILYRPIGLQELVLIYDSGMKAFPPTRCAHRHCDEHVVPVHTCPGGQCQGVSGTIVTPPASATDLLPVPQLEYARQTASGWNTQKGQFAGYVTQFKVEDEYIGQFEEHTVGEAQHQELWIPAEEVEEFNKHIIRHLGIPYLGRSSAVYATRVAMQAMPPSRAVCKSLQKIVL